MRPVTVTQAAAGFSAWIPVNWLSSPTSVALFGMPSSNATLTYGAQHTPDDPAQTPRTVGLSQTTTTITVTDAGPTTNGHGLSVADSVQIQNSGIGVDGSYAVASVVDQTHYTVTSTVSQTATGAANSSVQTFRVFNHVSLTGISIRQDGNYAFPVQAVRLNVSAYTIGYVSLTVLAGSW